MKNLFYCMIVFMTALVFPSCSSDDDPAEEIIGDFSYTEPLCDWGTAVDDIKSSMESYPEFKLTGETTSNLVYTSTGTGSVLSYNFTVIGLFSAQAMVDQSHQAEVLEVLKGRYQQTATGGESTGSYFFYPSDKSTSITTGKGDGYFYVNYVRVTK